MGGLQVRELHPAFGAEIEGLEPVIPLDDATRRQLREAFDQRGVLLFRNLDIDETFQRHLVYLLIGEEAPADPVDDGLDGEGEPKRKPMHVSNKEKGGAAPYGRLLFHCDSMWARRPQPIISLYGIEVEQPSVPTSFVSMAHGWESLDPELRARVEGLEARHGYEHSYPNWGADEFVVDAYYEDPRSVVTPVANTHPRVDRTMLYVSEQATIEILGQSEAENEALLTELFTQLYDPSSVLQHQWRTGDLVVWDNRAVQHGRAPVSLDGPSRTLRKVFGPMSLDPDEIQLPSYSKARV
jgi:alpha-ketoglutarate-dependent taurine dioxygenase